MGDISHVQPSGSTPPRFTQLLPNPVGAQAKKKQRHAVHSGDPSVLAIVFRRGYDQAILIKKNTQQLEKPC